MMMKYSNEELPALAAYSTINISTQNTMPSLVLKFIITRIQPIHNTHVLVVLGKWLLLALAACVLYAQES